MASFHQFNDLPYELQTYIFTFLPARTLHKTIARTNKHYMAMVDAYTRRRLLRLIGASSAAKSPKNDDRPETVLVVGRCWLTSCVPAILSISPLFFPCSPRLV